MNIFNACESSFTDAIIALIYKGKGKKPTTVGPPTEPEVIAHVHFYLQWNVTSVRCGHGSLQLIIYSHASFSGYIFANEETCSNPAKAATVVYL